MKRIISTIFICAFCFAAIAQAQGDSCPKIIVTGPSSTINRGDQMEFYVTVGNRLTKDYRYDWTVSLGTIISGQGTPIIRVGTNAARAGSVITALVKVSSLPGHCENASSDTGSVTAKLEGDPVNRFGKITNGNVRAYLDNFLVEMMNDANSKGLIALKLNKNWSYGQKYYFVKLRYDHLVFRKIDKTRITFSLDLNDGYDEEETALWIVPPGAEFPEQDNNKIRFIKAEDMSKELDGLFKKKNK
jgi:hypothetical protein